jgi:type II secretion system protein G
MHRNKNVRGFTLIELLVVIAIIGLLASIVLIALNSARQKSRDAKRIGDLRQIQTALELYYNDNGGYPPGICDSVYTISQPTAYLCWQTFLSGYIPTIPVDPLNSAASGYYYSYGGGVKPNGCSVPIHPATTSNYILTARLENYTASPNGCATTFTNWIDNGTVNYVVGQ